MSDVKNFVSVTDRSTKAIATATGNLAKVVAELNTLASSSEQIAEEIQLRQGELNNINADFDQKFAEAQAALKIKVLGNEDKVLADLLKARGLVTIDPTELQTLRDTLATAQQSNEQAISDAVAVAERNGQTALRAALATQEANHKVAIATLEANSSAKDDRISMLSEQLEAARGDLKAERETRLAIAQAESQRQGVVVNAGK
ncbi:hypothetical protein Erwinia_phage_Pastis_00069 [Erwinia phage Pastis]|nr:hypothetical protein Erwinia_phage_Pastis_00069 [Erwinia phage Pastis]